MSKSLTQRIKLQPYFAAKDFTLYKGDSLDLLKAIPNATIDMIFADPPYNLSNNGISVKSGKMVSVNKGKWDKSKGFEVDSAFHEAWLKECCRVLKPNGTIWVSGTYHSIYQCGFAMQKIGFHFLNDIIWFKPNAAPNLGCRCFTASHETLIWARKDKKAKHTFNYEIAKNGDWVDDALKKPLKQMRSLWSVTPPGKNEKLAGKHPTQKPLRLLDRIIRITTNKGDIILDPFAGSSSTGITAANLKRKFIGLEKEKGFLELSKKRFLTQ